MRLPWIIGARSSATDWQPTDKVHTAQAANRINPETCRNWPLTTSLRRKNELCGAKNEWLRGLRRGDNPFGHSKLKQVTAQAARIGAKSRAIPPPGVRGPAVRRFGRCHGSCVSDSSAPRVIPRERPYCCNRPLPHAPAPGRPTTSRAWPRSLWVAIAFTALI